MKYIAYATTTGNAIGADPGITVKDEDPHTLAGEWDLRIEPVMYGDGPRMDEHGDYLDIEHADSILRRNGWERVGDWISSGGQWGARVEELGSKEALDSDYLNRDEG